MTWFLPPPKLFIAGVTAELPLPFLLCRPVSALHGAIGSTGQGQGVGGFFGKLSHASPSPFGSRSQGSFTLSYSEFLKNSWASS